MLSARKEGLPEGDTFLQQSRESLWIERLFDVTVRLRAPATPGAPTDLTFA